MCPDFMNYVDIHILWRYHPRFDIHDNVRVLHILVKKATLVEKGFNQCHVFLVLQ